MVYIDLTQTETSSDTTTIGRKKCKLDEDQDAAAMAFKEYP